MPNIDHPSTVIILLNLVVCVTFFKFVFVPLDLFIVIVTFVAVATD